MGVGGESQLAGLKKFDFIISFSTKPNVYAYICNNYKLWRFNRVEVKLVEAKKQNYANPPGSVTALALLFKEQRWLLDKGPELDALLGLCSSPEQANVVHHILGQFTYLDSADADRAIRSIIDQIIHVWKLGPKDTCVIAKDLDGKADSSAALQQMVKSKMAAHGFRSVHNFRARLRSALIDMKIKNLVLIDDFSGTGGSLNDLAAWVAKECQEIGRERVSLYAAFLAAQERAHKEYDKNLVTSFYSYKVEKKAISDSPTIDIDAAITAIRELSTNYGISKNPLGWEDSEAAFAVQNLNTPNNVFPILWKVRIDRNPIIPRMEK
ncbi:phosphoribosyltransferase-like protein [Agrobacterium rosae]